jgi:hypothetical protein
MAYGGNGSNGNGNEKSQEQQQYYFEQTILLRIALVLLVNKNLQVLN